MNSHTSLDTSGGSDFAFPRLVLAVPTIKEMRLPANDTAPALQIIGSCQLIRTEALLVPQIGFGRRASLYLNRKYLVWIRAMQIFRW